MLRHSSTRSHRKTLQLAAALVCAGACAMAQAATVTDSAVHHVATHARGMVAPRLNISLPQLPAARLQPQPTGLDGKRAMLGHDLDLRPAAENRWGTEEQPHTAFPIQWRESREIVNADIVSMVRNYRRNGLPIVHLWQSDHNLVALGLNNHGVPGLYFTRHVGE